MITLTMSGWKNSLTVKKDSNSNRYRYKVSLCSQNGMLQKIGLFKTGTMRKLTIDFQKYPLQMHSLNDEQQAEIDVIKDYLKKRLESSFWTTREPGDPELRFNKLSLGTELLDLLCSETDNLVGELNNLHVRAVTLQTNFLLSTPLHSYAGGELGRLLVKLLRKYDENFNEKYQKDQSKLEENFVQAGRMALM